MIKKISFYLMILGVITTSYLMLTFSDAVYVAISAFIAVFAGALHELIKDME